ncbi:MAG: ABC transporter permease subunit [bacterium]|nr:ABC transporter permease subunit [bacterium]
MAAARSTRNGLPGVSILQDARFLQAVSQLIFAVLVVTGVWAIAWNVLRTLQAQNLTPNFAFMSTRAGFDIAAAPEWYTSQSTFWDAYLVGFINTLRVVALGLFLATMMGVFFGIFLLSSNFLLRTLARVYVEILRNTPLLVQLFVWYFIVMLSLPVYQQSLTFPAEGVFLIPVRWLFYLPALLIAWAAARRTQQRPILYGTAALLIAVEVLSLLNVLPAWNVRIEVLPLFYANIKGIVLPEIWTTARFVPWLVCVAGGFVVAVIVAMRIRRIRDETGRIIPTTAIALGLFLTVMIGSWFILSTVGVRDTVEVDQNGTRVEIPISQAVDEELLTPEQQAEITPAPMLIVVPVRGNFDFERGSIITPEYTALLLGLSVYTSAFIAEIVRAGIQAVPYGQVEAARSIGLKYDKVLRLIVLPQALRVIIPPLGNQYLNLAKNSSLAIAVAFADLFQVTTTIMNTSGQSVPGMILVMLTYLVISLTISLTANIFNRRLKLVAN